MVINILDKPMNTINMEKESIFLMEKSMLESSVLMIFMEKEYSMIVKAIFSMMVCGEEEKDGINDDSCSFLPFTSINFIFCN